MNRGKKLKQMRRFINQYGVIDKEHKRPPNKNYPSYRKGSYFVSFYSEELGLSVASGHINKYEAYKGVVEEIRRHIKE